MTTATLNEKVAMKELSLDRPARILVAEDEHLVAMHLVEHLEALGYEVVGPACDGSELVTLAKTDRPDMALVDIRMPGMTGLEAAGVLFPQMGIPVVMVSAFSDQDYVEAGAKVGVFGYLLKPVNADDLRVGIEVAWSRYKSEVGLRGEVSELKTALANRKIIERAKGILMKKLEIQEDEAMRRLQKQARNSRIKLVDLAQAIINAEELLEDA